MATSPQWPALALRATLARQAKVLTELADKMVLGEELPSRTPGDLRDLVRTVVDLVKRHLSVAPDKHLVHVARLFADLGEHLRYIERSRVHQTPWSLIPALELFAHDRVSSVASFIFRPKWAFNYAINGDFVSFYQYALVGFDWIPAEECKKRLERFIERPIYAVSFPRMERLNVLLHTNFGHEFGHLIAYKWLKERFDGFWNSIEPEVRTQIRKQISATIPVAPANQLDLFRQYAEQEKVANWVRQARFIAEQGLKELISDAVGAYLFGPSALLAAADVAARFDMDANPLSMGGYPPWRFRLRRIFEQLKDDINSFSDSAAGWAEDFVTMVDNIRESASLTTDIETLRADARTSFIYEEYDKKWTSFRLEALALLPNKVDQPYGISTRLEELKQLKERLIDLVPPNETGPWDNPKPADMRDILTAGWIHVAEVLKKQQAADSIEHVENIQRLVLKAIETSYWITQVDKKPV